MKTRLHTRNKKEIPIAISPLQENSFWVEKDECIVCTIKISQLSTFLSLLFKALLFPSCALPAFIGEFHTDSISISGPLQAQSTQPNKPQLIFQQDAVCDM